MNRVTLFILLSIVALASCRSVIFNRKVVPKGYVRGGFSALTVPVRFVVALKQRNLDLLDDAFWAVSTPGSPQYREFTTVQKIREMVSPAKEHHDHVVAWLKKNGIRNIFSHGDAIEARTTVRVAEKLFNTKFYKFREVSTGRTLHRTFGESSVPTDIAVLIDFVDGISSLHMPKYNLKPSNPNQNLGVVPQSITTFYNFPSMTNNAHPESSQALIEFEGQNFAPSDWDTYSSQEVNIPITDVTDAHTVGPNDPTNPQLEATLDVQWAGTINNAVTTWFWIEGGDLWLYDFCLDFEQYAAQNAFPYVLSVSYGWSEADQCDIDPDQCQNLGVDSWGYVKRVNTEFQKIGMLGVSIIVASGDSGANGRTDPDCSEPFMRPDYPAASPYVTSVGATEFESPQQFNLNGNIPVCQNQGFSCPSSGNETAVSYDQSFFASGGGFSNVALMPSYQTTAVKAYLSNSKVTLPPSSYFNATCRGYPDVAAIGSSVLVYQSGIEPVGGTSCSAPNWAAVVSLLNVYSLQKTSKPLGFLNPFLYQAAAKSPSVFSDIIYGDNFCTEDGCSPSCEGYYCAVGWDPVTGLGSPNVNNLISYVQNML